MTVLSSLNPGDLVYTTKKDGSKYVFLVLVHNNADYPNATCLIAKDIDSLKAFDAKEPNNVNADRRTYGNNRYLWSNIRQWLNSSANAGQWYVAQHSTDTPPNSVGVTVNPYDNIAGWLNGFDEELIQRLQEITQTISKNTIADGGGQELVKSKVHLLTATQVGLGNPNNNITEGVLIPYFSNNNSRIAMLNGQVKYWWLATPFVGSSASERFVYSDGSILSYDSNDATAGIRPSIALPLTTPIGKKDPTTNAYELFAIEPHMQLKTGNALYPPKKAQIKTSGVLQFAKKIQAKINGAIVTVFQGRVLPDSILGLSVGRQYLGSASNDKYALFAGGTLIGANTVATIDTFDANFVRTTPTAMTVPKKQCGVGNVGRYLVVAGGINAGGTELASAEAWDENLTKVIAPDLSTPHGFALQSTASTKNHMLLGSVRGVHLYTVETYDANLVRDTAGRISELKSDCAIVSFCGSVIFAGGVSGEGYSSSVYRWDENLTKTVPTSLSSFGASMVGVVAGEYMLIGGGYGGTSSLAINVYDKNFTKLTSVQLTEAMTSPVAASAGQYGVITTGSPPTLINAFDENLVRSIPEQLAGTPLSRSRGTGTSFNGCAMFAGGLSGTVLMNAVDVYDGDLNHITSYKASRITKDPNSPDTRFITNIPDEGVLVPEGTDFTIEFNTGAAYNTVQSITANGVSITVIQGGGG